MWRFLGEALMKKLKTEYDEGDSHIYQGVIKQSEDDIIHERISGHEAAMRIINAIFRTDVDKR